MSARAFLTCLTITCCPVLCLAGDHTFHHENVLGTSMEFQVTASSEKAAIEAEGVALREIERLRPILSSYESDSELSRFVRTPVNQEVGVSADLFAVLSMCDEWQHVSGGAFNPAVERLSEVWREANKTGMSPAKDEITGAVRSVNEQHWQLNESRQTAIRLSQCSLSLNAIAKGYILDAVVAKVMDSSDNVTGVMINIGGDIRLSGTTKTSISIATPRSDAIGATPLTEVSLATGAVATSGTSERSVQIGSTSRSHIVDPRSGVPADDVISATVLAPSASTADAMATICSVLTVADSLALVNSMASVHCLLVSNDGVITTSANWPQGGKKKPVSGKPTKKKPEPTGHEMLVEFEIGKPSNARRYRRPYVAVWVEDKDKFPVKTLSLFLMQNNPGPRWYRDVRRWYADDQMRKLVDKKDMIKTVSKPTRNPGKYKVVWDGRDDNGKLLKPGKYTLLIESAREHGSYRLIKKEFEFGKPLKKTKLKANTEITAASMTYKASEAGARKSPAKKANSDKGN